MQITAVDALLSEANRISRLTHNVLNVLCTGYGKMHASFTAAHTTYTLTKY